MTLEPLIATALEELGRALRSVDEGNLARLREMLREAQCIFVAGRGRSGLQMSGFAMRLMHMGLAVHVVGDVTTPGIAAVDLVVIGSGSGRTASLVGYAARARDLGAHVALITAAEHSPIGEAADCVVRIDAPTPKLAERYDISASILPMGSLFEQALGLLLDLVILQLMRDLNIDGARMFARHANLE
jgi:6-phospho-3-hexuloisomerase